MSPQGKIRRLDLLWILRLGLFCLSLASFVYGGPIHDLGPPLTPSRSDREPQLPYASSQQREENSLAKREAAPNIYGTGSYMGQDSDNRLIYGFYGDGACETGPPSGIIEVKHTDEWYRGTISRASILTFDKPRHIGNVESPEWRVRYHNDDFQINLAATYTWSYKALNGVRMMEKLPKREGTKRLVPVVYKALEIPFVDPQSKKTSDGSLILEERLDKSLWTLREKYSSQQFKSLVMFRQWTDGLAQAHGLGIAHGDVRDENLMLSLQPNDWRIIGWDNAVDFTQKPVVRWEKDRAFAEDTRWIGNYLFELALPSELKKFITATSNFDGQSSDLVKLQLEEMFDFKKQQAFLDILSGTLCQVPMPMAELNSALYKLPGDKIPMLRERKQAECRGTKSVIIRCYISKGLRIFKIDTGNQSGQEKQTRAMTFD